MNEHQRINQTNYNTVQGDLYIARSLGMNSWKSYRKMRSAALAKGPQNPYKTSGRREMRSLLESLRTFEPSPVRPNGNRETRRGYRGDFATQLSLRGLKVWKEAVGTGSLL